MLDSYRDLIDSLLPSPTALRGVFGNPVPQDVSPEIARTLRELAVREAVNLRRMQSAMRQEPVMLLAIADEKDLVALATDPGTSTPEENLAAFSHDRSELISVLVNLTLRDWERPINHDRSGDTTIADEIDAHLTWDEETVEALTSS